MNRLHNVIKIEHINAQSFFGRFEEIKTLVEERNIGILCISEPWIHPEMVRNFVIIQKFKAYTFVAGRGKVACIYVRDTLKSNRISITRVKKTAVEDIWVIVQGNMLPASFIGAGYRHLM